MTANQSDEPTAVVQTSQNARPGRARTALLVLGAVAAIVLLALWLERKPITASYIDGQLAQRGVTARYRISDLGLGRQRLTEVVIGDSKHPDLIADWIELRTHVGLSGFTVDAVRAGHVRLRGRIVGGRLTLGEIDKLLPATGGRFTLPAIAADIADARMRLETAQGLIGLKLSGRGRLNDGFAGQVAAVSDRMDIGTCRADGLNAVMAVRVAAGAPTLDGPVRATDVTCGSTIVQGAGATVKATLSRTFDRWSGSARLMATSARATGVRLAGIGGTVSFDGIAKRTAGDFALTAAGFASPSVSGTALTVDGQYEVAGAAATVKARVRAARATASASAVASLRALTVRASGTPVAPLAGRLTQAVTAAARAFAIDADVAAKIGAGGGAVSVSRGDLSAASGAHIALADAAVAYRWPQSALRLAGTLKVNGGGLPGATVRFDQAAPGGSISGVASVAPYAAGNARLSFTPISFTAAPGGATRITTTLRLSGPIGDGRVDGLTAPIDARWDGRTRLTVDTACTPVSFDRLALAGLTLRPARFTLCPTAGAVLAVDGPIVRGGGRIAAPRVVGMLGSSPITASAASLNVDLTGPTFAADRLAVRIGAPARVTRLDFTALDGRMVAGQLAGHFAGGAGQIGNVPLLLSQAHGAWQLQNGALAMTGALSVDDAAQPVRFKTLIGRDVRLTLAGGTIEATGTLATPATGIEVAQVRIVHDLARGAGHADLTVPGIAFGKTLQPDALTPLTYGVIADVAGTVSGAGHIRWTPGGITSDGTFSTSGTDLAAAFGPVTGIAGTIHFTDLLSLQSAPGQVATIKSVNPGVPVNNGTIRYQTLPNARIRIEEGRWPFAGGTLALEPTLLDFGEAQERRMTFRVTGMDAAQFLQQFDFKNLNATGTFDGVLPMIFDAQGGRIEKGDLHVRTGGGTIAYVGEISQKDLGTWGNLAFQTLKSLKYRSLDITMNGPLAGEMITQVRFAGIGQGEGAKHNFIVSRLAKLPFVFNVRIAAPFRSLIDSAASLYDPKRLIERNLPALIDEQNKAAGVAAPVPANPIQPPESRSVR